MYIKKDRMLSADIFLNISSHLSTKIDAVSDRFQCSHSNGVLLQVAHDSLNKVLDLLV